jgi:signal transduction histidine kinase
MAKGDGTADQLAIAHKDPDKLTWASEIQRYFPPRWDAPNGLPNVLRTGQPEIYEEITDEMLVAVAENELQLDLLRQVGYSSAMIVPLNSRGETLGAITLAMAESGRHFTEEDLSLAGLLAERAAVAIDNARLYEETEQLNQNLEERVRQRTQELRRINEQLADEIDIRQRTELELMNSQDVLRALAARLQSIREEERTEIARELHDELGQALTALKMDVSSLISRLPQRSTQVRERARAISEQIDGTIRTVRRLSAQLRPGMLDDLGLGPALEWYAHEWKVRTGIECVITTPPDDIELTHGQATAVFRIFQETLTNVVRHANATRVEAALTVSEGHLQLKVQDNGRGMDPEQVRGTRSLGLLGMRERAGLLGGTLNISSSSSEGTTITLDIPLTPGQDT